MLAESPEFSIQYPYVIKYFFDAVQMYKDSYSYVAQHMTDMSYARHRKHDNRKK